MIEALEPRVFLSRTWFVAPVGNDGFPGTIGQPLHTIQRAASLAQPGDTVYVRGGVYHETVTPARSGSAGAPITFAAYNNEHVVIDGADPVTGWSRYGNGSIYSAAQPWDLGEGNNQVFVDWSMINEARWPNGSLDPTHPATAPVDSVYSSAPGTAWLFSDTATIRSSSLPGGPGAWVGATIHIGNGQDWVVQTGTVVNSTAGALTFAYQHQTSYETPVAGNRFYLTGKFQALDAPGEWYRDPTTGRLYIWTPSSANPTSHTVEAKHRLYAFELSGRSYIDIVNIHFFAATIDTDAYSTHNVFTGILADYVSSGMLNPVPWNGRGDPSATGIVLNGSYNVLRNSTIQYSSGDGVFLGGYDNAVRNCVVNNADYSGADYAGIAIAGANNQVLSSLIYDTGRDGILDSDAISAKILNNTIHDAGLQTTDMGGIYDHGTDSHGTVIAYNLIYNVRSNGYGGNGIYLDNGSADYIVHDNAISNTNLAIKLNPPSYSDSVYNNKINGQLVANQSSGGGSPVAYPRTYTGSATTTLLGTLGEFTSDAFGLNDAGQVVGSSLAAASSPAFLYTGGTMYTLPTLGGGAADAYAINAQEQIAGGAAIAGGAQHAFFYSRGVIYNLGVLPGDIASAAAALNNNYQVVGTSYNSGGIGHAFLYSNGAMHYLGTLGGSVSQASGINDQGQVVGAATLAGNYDARAFVYAGGSMHDLGTLGGNSSYALAINNAGQIAGESLTAGNAAMHAFIEFGGRMRDIGSLPGFRNSAATAIDAAGDVVGYAWNSDISISHAFYYHNGVMADLNTLLPAGAGWTLLNAAAINNHGQIVGSATDANQEKRAFILSLPG